MEFVKNFYYGATINGIECELAIRSDFKGDFTSDDYLIVQSREPRVHVRVDGVKEHSVTSRYYTMTRKELRKALNLSPQTKIEIRG